jgi:hypothetical protein
MKEFSLAEQSVIKKFKRTNLFMIDEELWAWASYRAKILGYDSASEYVFDLIKLDKEAGILKKR